MKLLLHCGPDTATAWHYYLTCGKNEGLIYGRGNRFVVLRHQGE